MKTLSRIIISITFAVILSQGLFAQESCDYPSDDEWFSFCIEQNGTAVPSVNGRVEIEKKPFTLVLVMKEPLGILVNCSLSDTLYKGFRKNKPLSGIIAQPDLFMGIGEAPFNPDEMILIDEIAPHYLYYADEASHRFSNVELKNGYIIGRRIISNFTAYAYEFVPAPLTTLNAEELYLSLMYSEYDDNYNVIELQKEALKVIFKD